MKMRLLDIDKFIIDNDVKLVNSHKIYSGGSNTELDPSGLYSEQIFGRVGTPQRKKTFGYINLNCKVIHPEAYPIISSLSPEITKILLGKTLYSLDENGVPIQDENGKSGLLFFISNLDNINFEKLISDKRAGELEFLKRVKNRILIDKYLVLPAGIRDIQLDKSSGKSFLNVSEIGQMYERLLRQTNSIFGDVSMMPDQILEPIVEKIQYSLISINTWIKDRMKGKYGVIRKGLLSKITDYSARMVISPDPSVKLGEVALPFQVILKLLEPFSLHYFFQKDPSLLIEVQKHLDTSEMLDVNDVRRFIKIVSENPKSLDEQLRLRLIAATKEIAKNRVVVYKRDPAENRDSWLSAYIRVDDISHTMKINPFDCNKHGGDFDGDKQCVA